MQGFGLGLAVGIGSGMAIGIGSGMHSGRSDVHKKIKGLITEGKIRIIDIDGNIITTEEFIALL